MMQLFCAWMLVSVAAVMAPPKQNEPVTASTLASDETIILFPSRAVQERSAREWVIPLRGWVFEREEDSAWRNAAIDKCGEEMGLTEDEINSDVFRSRARAFLCDNERGKRIGIGVAGRTFVMPETGEDGHFEGVIRLSDAEMTAAIADREASAAGKMRETAKGGGARAIELTVENAGGAEIIAASVRVVESTGLLVVCDIDDTIKVSNIGDREKLLRATFVDTFKPVPGMRGLLRRLADGGAGTVEFHYLSASPWQLYEPLAAFLRDNGFPEGGITLREFRMKDERILNLFRKPTEYKLAELARLAAEMPERKFILIGDSTEHDAELYVRFAKDNPGRVTMILIRGTPGDLEGQERARAMLEKTPEGTRGVCFEDPASIRLDDPALEWHEGESPR